MVFEALSSLHLAAILSGLLLFLLFRSRMEKHVNLPPGPRGLPLFGSILKLANANNGSLLLMEMAKDYGPVMSVRLGSRFGIVLTGFDVIRDALVEKADIFSSRPDLDTKSTRKEGILRTSQWKERRKLALTSMRDFGLGKKSLDERMYEEAGILIQELETSSGKLVNLHTLLPVVTTNIICSIIRGERFAYNEDVIQEIVACFKDLVATNEFTDIENYMTWVKFIPFRRFLNVKAWKGERRHQEKRMAIILQTWIEEHKSTFEEDDIRDLIDLFISESKREGGSCKEENILQITGDLLVAGTDTTSTTLLWSIAYLIIHNDIQAKCRQEIHEVVGKNKIPDYSHSKGLPYFNSFLHELQRMANVVPLALTHGTSSSVELGGYTVPKGSVVIVNLESALKDEKYWGDPYTFRPERWLDEDGKIIKHQAFIPFSMGKRACLGELLAKKELFIFLSSMLQKFYFEMEDEENPPKLAKGEGTIRSAPQYLVRVTKI